jgi:hypothetical protein
MWFYVVCLYCNVMCVVCVGSRAAQKARGAVQMRKAKQKKVVENLPNIKW